MRQIPTVIALTLLSVLTHERSATDAFSSSSSSPSLLIHNHNINSKKIQPKRSTRIRRRDERRPSTSSLSMMMFQVGSSVNGRGGGRLGRRSCGSITTNGNNHSNYPTLHHQSPPKYDHTPLLPPRTPTHLHQSPSPNNNEDKDNSTQKLLEKEEPSKEPSYLTFLTLLRTRLTSLLPAPLLTTLTTFQTRLTNFFPTLRLALTSFTVGLLLALTLVLVPVYDSVDRMTEPVTLFETILADLDRGYVDKVDTKKLFETGVNAMLRSLDPYTEFEGKQEAADLTESVSGKYGGIGLVISGTRGLPQRDETVVTGSEAGSSSSTGGRGILPQDALDDEARLSKDEDDDLLDVADDADEDLLRQRREEAKILKKSRERGIRVISAMEGYAFDYGMRSGDKIVAVDSKRITPNISVDDVRNMLRGEPGSRVAITIEREGVVGERVIEMPRTLVQMRDVKLTTLLGDAKDGVGYLQLTGFTANSGSEVRNSIFALQKAAEAASEGGYLKGLILDLRSNPGGLLTSAVDVSSLFVPQGSEIVSARGRGFPSVRYVSRVQPLIDPTTTKVAVLINSSTASAAEIVSGAIQDLDCGVIVGSERTFGKGLVQNVADLPFDTALKFTVAKYYTPSGRCIQSTNYKAGELSTKVKDRDKTVFYTANGREVRDGGGIAADLKVDPPQASALEVTLLRSGSMNDFAAEWSRNNELTDKFMVDSRTYKDFQNFVTNQQKAGDLKLDALYSGPIDQLKNALKESGYNTASREVKLLEERILSEMKGDFIKYSEDIKEDIGQSILARYIPDSMLRERSLKTDKQVIAAKKLMTNDKQYDKLLGRKSPNSSSDGVLTTLASRTNNRSGAGASIVVDSEDDSAVKLNLKF